VDGPPRALKQIAQRVAVDKWQSDEHGRVFLVVGFQVVRLRIVGNEGIAVFEIQPHDERVRLRRFVRRHACQQFSADL
jgi:hypothetical protein